MPQNITRLTLTTSNLSPRGMSDKFSSQDESLTPSLNGLFLRNRQGQMQVLNGKDERKYGWIIFCWHGTESSPIVKAQAHCKAIELEDMLKRAKEACLQLLFSGAVVRNAKLQKGVIIPIGSLGEEDNLAKINSLVKNN